MINLATITTAVQTLLRANLESYVVERNARRNHDPNRCTQIAGLINVRRGGNRYEPFGTGSQPWKAGPRIDVEVQVATGESAEAAEDLLQAAEAQIMDVLTANKKLGGTVDMTTGYDIRYEFNDEAQVYHHAAIITIMAEARA